MYPNAIVGNTTIFSQPQSFDPEEFRSALYASPLAEGLRWWKAAIDPTSNKFTGAYDSAVGKAVWMRTEQSVREFKGVVKGFKVARQMFGTGQIINTDIVVTTMVDEIPIGDHDWIMPVGNLITPGRNYDQDKRTIQIKCLIVRGSILTEQSGTVSSSGPNVTGVGTTFTITVQAGDVMNALSVGSVIESVADDTHLTLLSAPATAWSGNKWSKATDNLPYQHGVYIEDAFDADRAYVPGAHYTISDDGGSVQWLSAANSPAPGSRYSVTYRYIPRFVAQPELGVQRHVVNGADLMQTIVCRLAVIELRP